MITKRKFHFCYVNNLAQFPARSKGIVFTTTAPAFVAAVDAGPGMHIADICCGHGAVTKALAATGAMVTGVDFSAAMLELARENVPEARFAEGNAMALDFADDSLDAVTIGFGIPHVPEPEKVFGEVRRVLRKGGRFAYTVWHGMEADGAFRWLFQAVQAHGDKDIALPPAPLNPGLLSTLRWSPAGRLTPHAGEARSRQPRCRCMQTMWNNRQPIRRN